MNGVCNALSLTMLMWNTLTCSLTAITLYSFATKFFACSVMFGIATYTLVNAMESC